MPTRLCDHHVAHPDRPPARPVAHHASTGGDDQHLPVPVGVGPAPATGVEVNRKDGGPIGREGVAKRLDPGPALEVLRPLRRRLAHTVVDVLVLHGDLLA